MKKNLIIFTDIGDTIIDEGTEVRKRPQGVVYHADCIPEAKETMLTLYEQGYTIVMVADGLEESFRNTMEENGLSHIFTERIISELIGTEKPDCRMFQAAMDSLRLKPEDKSRIIMVGNNLSRDIAGANRFGITSVHLCWSPRYAAKPAAPEEKADYTITHPAQLLKLADMLESRISESVKQE